MPRQLVTNKAAIAGYESDKNCEDLILRSSVLNHLPNLIEAEILGELATFGFLPRTLGH